MAASPLLLYVALSVAFANLVPIRYINHLDNSTLTYRGKSFDVDLPLIKLKYSEVFWNVKSVPLPADIIAAFANKTIALTGFESTRYIMIEGQPVLAKAYELYNHHWGIAITGTKSSDSDIARLMDPTNKGHNGMSRLGRGTFHGTASRAWGYANGGEDRLSYKGWPEGTACLLESPHTFLAELMFINTKNPLSDGNRVGPLPKIYPGPRDGPYSGLCECPCSDRHVFDYNKSTIDGWACNFSPGSQPDCLKNNTANSIYTYTGGLRCCNDKTLLVDKDQVYDGSESFFFKFRFYYEDAKPSTRNTMYAHIPIDSSEYDVPVCAAGSPPEECFHVVERNVSGKAFVVDANLTDTDVFELNYCHAHMHVGALFMELWDVTDANDPLLLCNNTARIGRSNEVYDELGYTLGMENCFWGYDGTLPTPPLIKATTRLLARAFYNNTHPHHGAMARSSCYGVLAIP